MSRYLTLRNLFSLFLIAWFGYGVWEARSYAFLAKIFPFYISLVLFISVQRYGIGWLTRPGVIIMAVIIVASLSASIAYQRKLKTAGKAAASKEG
jgi:hypothetical protein